MRIDLFIAKHFNLSRQKAQELIKNGCVLCNQKKIIKTSYDVGIDDNIKLMQENLFVSRAAHKLFGFLKEERLDGKVILDVGSSTGGFTQVLLMFGAKEVHCVDVGSDQLDSTLRRDNRVRVFEKCDIRDFEKSCEYDFLTCDVSFISIEKIFNSLKKMSKEMILLFKPQFEVGKSAKRDKKGVLQDVQIVAKALENFEKYLIEAGYDILRYEKSKIRGREGNEEYFFHIRCRD